ncbi:MAG TPA: RDD family protein, partial [Acidimicrobiia bacterium]|nr:RDD family protein [Acidimicrobiia bacterium]
GGYVIDIAITGAVFIVGIVIAGLTVPESSFDNPDPGPTALGWLVMLACLGATFAYFPYFEGRPAGQTPGKKAVGTRVVRQSNGASLGFGLAIGRTFARILDGFVFMLGLLWAIWDPQRQTWHDKIAGTLVVRASVYPPPSPSPTG